MFHITAIVEDTQLVLTHNGENYVEFVTDGHTGTSKTVTFSHNELASIMSLALHNDGTPPGTDEHYAIAEPAMAREGISENPLRLIP